MRPRRQATLGLLLAAAALMPGVLATPLVNEAPWGAWRTIAFESASVQEPSASITDASGVTHVAWGASGIIKYAAFNGIQWSTSTVAPIVGNVLGIALTDAGRPVIAIRASFVNPAPDTSNLQYAWHDGTSWNREIVDPGPGAGTHGRLRLGSDGIPRIAYTASGPTLKYAWKDGSGWHSEQVDTQNSAWLEMDLGPQNDPQIAMTQLGTFWGELAYYTRSSPGTWIKQIVDGVGGSELGIAVDGNGDPHISYRDEGEDLGYAVRAGTTWTLSVVDSSGRTGYATSIDIDQHGRPHIAYRTIGAPLRYAALRADGSWSKETADATTTAAAFETDLHLDSNGVPHVVWRGMMVEPFVATAHRVAAP